MKRFVCLAALSVIAVLMFASVALAQDYSSIEDPANCPAGTKATWDYDGAMGSGEFLGCVPVGELCDVDTLTASQYSECIATPEEITGVPAGEEIPTGSGIPEYVPEALPDTGGPSVLLAGGVLLSGAGILGLSLARRRTS